MIIVLVSFKYMYLSLLMKALNYWYESNQQVGVLFVICFIKVNLKKQRLLLAIEISQ